MRGLNYDGTMLGQTQNPDILGQEVHIYKKEAHIPPAALCLIEESFPAKGIQICWEFCSAFNLCSAEVLEPTTLPTQISQRNDLKRGTSSGRRSLS